MLPRLRGKGNSRKHGEPQPGRRPEKPKAPEVDRSGSGDTLAVPGPRRFCQRPHFIPPRLFMHKAHYRPHPIPEEEFQFGPVRGFSNRGQRTSRDSKMPEFHLPDPKERTRTLSER